jgi:hypothetical protein
MLSRSREGAAVVEGGHVGVLGGTGPLGRGIAARLALAGHVVRVGSRSHDRAVEAVRKVEERTGPDVEVHPAENAEAVEDAAIVVVAVPYEGQAATLEAIEPGPGILVVIAVNPMVMDEVGPMNVEVPGGSAAEENQAEWPGTRGGGARGRPPRPAPARTGSASRTSANIAGKTTNATKATSPHIRTPGSSGANCQ